MLSYIYCIIFKKIRYKYFMVFEDGYIKKIYLNHTPDILYFSKQKKYYSVISETSEIINKTLVYNWLKVEELNK